MRIRLGKCSMRAAAVKAAAWLAIPLLLGAAGLQDARPDALHLREEPITPVPQPPLLDARRVALGRALFSDARLSRDGTVSCASCHDLGGNGAMPRRQIVAPDGGPLPFDTQTVFNAALSFRFNWEGNARTLAAQAAIAIESTDIMAGNVDHVARMLRGDDAMRAAFEAAYGHGPDPASLLDAIATFERTLLTPSSRFDLWLRGDDAALTALELEGYRTFKAVGCVSCHQGVNVGGNLFEPHGIFRSFGGPAPPLLRVPSLRNIAATAPYFHDGSAATLAQAVRTMASAQLGRNLSASQVESVVAFLGTLTGHYEGVPVAAPQ